MKKIICVLLMMRLRDSRRKLQSVEQDPVTESSMTVLMSNSKAVDDALFNSISSPLSFFSHCIIYFSLLFNIHKVWKLAREKLENLIRKNSTCFAINIVQKLSWELWWSHCKNVLDFTKAFVPHTSLERNNFTWFNTKKENF